MPSTDLVHQVEKFKLREGVYPQAVLADQIYRTRANRKWCKDKGIRLSGTPLGRPSNSVVLKKEQSRIQNQDNRERNAIEGKFGQGKRRFGLSKIMAKLKETSECVISISFILMNLEKLLERLFFSFFQKITKWISHQKDIYKNFNYITMDL